MKAQTATSPEGNVARAFAAFPDLARRKLLDIRSLIFAVAAETEGVGPLTETLKWGEPAYLTEASSSGSTIRLGMTRGAEPRCAIFLNCNTSLIERFRDQFSDQLAFEGNRAILLDETRPLPVDALGFCIAAALTYHLRKEKR